MLIHHQNSYIDNYIADDLKYKKAGIILTELSAKDFFIQTDILSANSLEKSSKLMSAMDKINKKYGNLTVKSSIVISKYDWFMKSEKKSPGYTTNWNELLVVN